MLLKEAKQSLDFKVASEGRKLPSEVMLSELFLEAMLYICTKCVPNELIRYNAKERVFRNVENGLYIRYPDKPIFDEKDPKYDENEHLMIDETLSYAVVNEVAFALTANPMYRQLCDEIVGEFIANDGKEMGQWIL